MTNTLPVACKIQAGERKNIWSPGVEEKRNWKTASNPRGRGIKEGFPFASLWRLRTERGVKVSLNKEGKSIPSAPLSAGGK